MQLLNRLRDRPLDPAVLEERQKDVDERVKAMYQKAQSRLGELVSYLRSATLEIYNLNSKLNPPDRRQLHTPSDRLVRPSAPCASHAKGILREFAETYTKYFSGEPDYPVRAAPRSVFHHRQTP